MASRNENRLIEKRDLVLVAITMAIALAVGVYLIATTVLIANDGIGYIGRAQQLASDPVKIIKTHPPGYPFLIFAAHGFAILFTGDSSILTWIYSAQSVTLMCRLLALVPLYFIGKLLVGGRNSFWALVILILLPYPARFGSDIMRDWPYLLFLASGFLLLLRAGKYGKLWLFAAAGLLAGTGYLIRIECAQIIVYGVAFLVGDFFSAKRMSRPRLLLAAVLLITGFAVSGGWYVGLTGELPRKVKKFINISCDHSNTPKSPHESADLNRHVFKAEFVPDDFVRGGIIKGFIKIVKRMNSTLMYVLGFPLIVGLWRNFRREHKDDTLRFFITAFAIFNTAMLLLLYRNYGYISRRHVMPLTAMLVFYVPTGLELVSKWFAGASSKGDVDKKLQAEKSQQTWFRILLFAGIAICIPKLVSPLHEDKKVYREISAWLMKNTSEGDVIVVEDARIGFYAMRPYFLESDCNVVIPRKVSYVVRIYDKEGKRFLPVHAGKVLDERYSSNYLRGDKEAMIVVYEVVEALQGSQ